MKHVQVSTSHHVAALSELLLAGWDFKNVNRKDAACSNQEKLNFQLLALKMLHFVQFLALKMSQKLPDPEGMILIVYVNLSKHLSPINSGL